MFSYVSHAELPNGAVKGMMDMVQLVWLLLCVAMVYGWLCDCVSVVMVTSSSDRGLLVVEDSQACSPRPPGRTT